MFKFPVVLLVIVTPPVKVTLFKSRLTSLVRLMSAVIGAVNLIVSPLFAFVIAVANVPAVLTLIVIGPTTSFRVYPYGFRPVHTIRAAFTAYSVPSIIKSKTLTYK